MTRVSAIAGLVLAATPAFAHPHHDIALNLTHSHAGEVGLAVLALAVAVLIYRRVIARR